MGTSSKNNRRGFLKKSAVLLGGSVYGSEPGESAAQKEYTYRKSVPVEENFDVVVAGGGPSGTSAAVSAARLGAKVLLVEATGCLGGMGTSGMVTAWPSIGNGKEVIVGGLLLEIVRELYDRKFFGPQVKSANFHKNWMHFNSEGYKLILDAKVKEAGCDLRFFTKVIDVNASASEKTLKGVLISNVNGLAYVKAKTFIDCTGDAHLAGMAGVPCVEAGKDTSHIMPASLLSAFSNIDFSRAEHGGSNSRYLLQAIDDGHFSQIDYHMTGIYRSGETMGTLNGGHLFDLNSLKNEDLTEGMIFGRKIAYELYTYYKKYVPGFEKIEQVATANLIGVRESRRIIGEYELSFSDFKAKREFPDQIGIFQYPVDIHPYKNSKEAMDKHVDEFNHSGKLDPGEHFGIPYSVIVPKGWKNLWVAGRSNSSDVYVSSSIRVQPACYMMGQAAGTAAVQSIHTGQPANRLNTASLVKSLRLEGAILPQSRLTDDMTRYS